MTLRYLEDLGGSIESILAIESSTSTLLEELFTDMRSAGDIGKFKAMWVPHNLVL